MRLELREKVLHLDGCQDDSVRNVVHILKGEKNKVPGNYAIPLTLDAIQYFQKHPDCQIEASIPAFLDSLRIKLDGARTPGTIDYQWKPDQPPPFDHQRTSFWFGTWLDQAILLLATGLGKTRTAIDIICYRFAKNGVRKALVVAPMSIHLQWADEIRHFATVPNIDIRIVRGSKPKRIKILQDPVEEGRLTIYLIHYEGVRVLRDDLRKVGFDMVVADESTQIKNHKAKQSKHLKKICSNIRYRIALTGTPIWNKPVDIFSQYQFLDTFWFGYSFLIFKNTFLMASDAPGGAIGYKNLDEMTRRLYSIGIRYKKEDCLKDLPPRNYQTRRVEMTAEQKKLYDEARKEFVVFIEDAQKQGLPRAIVIQNALVRLLKLQQICCGHAMDENRELVEIPTNKGKEIEGILDEIMGEPDKKVIIWCRFIHDIISLYNLLSQKYKCTKFFGSMGQEAKDAALLDFRGRRREDNTWEVGPSQIFIAQIRTGGVGLDLWMSDTAIFYSVEWSLGVREQAEGRNFRKGSERHQSVTYFDVICEDSIEEKILDALKAKKELADLIMEAKDLKKLF